MKVGDFGISKMITTLAQAHSVLGTPYYISPEMVISLMFQTCNSLEFSPLFYFGHNFQCEGKVYNEKSDIWALGCILYEMTCLQKTFDGSNLPAVVNRIMKVSLFY